MLVLHYVYFAIEDRYGEVPPFPGRRSRKTHVLNSQIKRYIAKLLMYISLTFHFRYILTEVAKTTKPFEACTAKQYSLFATHHQPRSDFISEGY